VYRTRVRGAASDRPVCVRSMLRPRSTARWPATGGGIHPLPPNSPRCSPSPPLPPVPLSPRERAICVASWSVLSRAQPLANKRNRAWGTRHFGNTAMSLGVCHVMPMRCMPRVMSCVVFWCVRARVASCTGTRSCSIGSRDTSAGLPVPAAPAAPRPKSRMLRRSSRQQCRSHHRLRLFAPAPMRRAAASRRGFPLRVARAAVTRAEGLASMWRLERPRLPPRPRSRMLAHQPQDAPTRSLDSGGEPARTTRKRPRTQMKRSGAASCMRDLSVRAQGPIYESICRVPPQPESRPSNLKATRIVRTAPASITMLVRSPGGAGPPSLDQAARAGGLAGSLRPRGPSSALV
jgi:hypothetical protein